MNKELYKLLCCMLPYEVECMIDDDKKDLIIGVDKIRETNIFLCKEWFGIEANRIKPLLKSELSLKDKEELGKIFGAKANDIGWIEDWIRKGDTRTHMMWFEILTAIEYLYSIHWYFGTDKSLFIEK